MAGFIGSGNISLDRYVNNAATSGYLPVGNCKGFAITPNAETKEQPDYRRGSYGNIRDATTINKQHTLSLTLTDFSHENLAMVLLGHEVTATQESVTAQAVSLTARPGKWQDLGYRRCTAITVAGMTEGTHFEVDLVAGLIMFLEGAGSPFVDDGDAVEVSVTAPAYSYPTVQGATTPNVKVALLGDMEDVNTGERKLVRIPKCNLKPSGAINWIGDDWGEITLEGTIEKLDTEDASYYIEDLRPVS